MAISAQRFKFLDKETNMPTTDFYQVSNNIVYNAASSTMNSAIAAIGESEGLLDSISGSMSELSDMVSSTVESIGKDLASALNSAIDTISKMSLPKIVTDIFDKLKSLDLNGVKGFIKDLLKVGSTMLCNNTDFLKLFTLGYAVNKNIMGGLLTALMFSWLDRFCNEFNKKEIDKESGLKRLETLVPQTGMLMTSSNALSNFTKTYGDYVKASSPISLSTPLDTASFIAGVTSGNVSSSVSNLKNSEISSLDKKSYLDAIAYELPNYSPLSDEHRNLLTAQGNIINTAFISDDRIEKTNVFSNISDQLGSMSKNLLNVDVSSLNKIGFNTLEKGLADKVKEYQTTVNNNPDMKTRNYSSGSFDDVDFKEILPPLNEEETLYLTETEPSGMSHREQDMHPTTSVFLENC